MSFRNRDNERLAVRFTLQSQLNSEKCVVLQIHKDISNLDLARKTWKSLFAFKVTKKQYCQTFIYQ